jgi:hypothetical protein
LANGWTCGCIEIINLNEEASMPFIHIMMYGVLTKIKITTIYFKFSEIFFMFSNRRMIS